MTFFTWAKVSNALAAKAFDHCEAKFMLFDRKYPDIIRINKIQVTPIR